VVTLRALFDRHNCDKGKRHGYERLYADLMPERMLEVGVLRGGSLRAWLEYWPTTHFTVVDDFRPESVPDVLSDPRVVWKNDDSRTVKVDGPFDLMIDDGAHDPDTQRKTFENLFPHCTGRYFIEDVLPLDDMTEDQQAEYRRWIDKGWIDGAKHQRDQYDQLIASISRYRVVRHDLRAKRTADSYVFEVSR